MDGKVRPNGLLPNWGREPDRRVTERTGLELSLPDVSTQGPLCGSPGRYRSRASLSGSSEEREASVRREAPGPAKGTALPVVPAASHEGIIAR